MPTELDDPLQLDSQSSTDDPLGLDAVASKKSDLAKQMRAARVEGRFTDAELSASDFAERAVNTVSLMNPADAARKAINPNGTVLVPPDQMRRFLYPAGGEFKPGSVEGAIGDFITESASSMTSPDALAALAAGKVSPAIPARYFQAQMIPQSGESANRLMQAKTPGEAVKSGLETAASVGFPLMIERSMVAKPGPVVPDASGRILRPPIGRVEPSEATKQAAMLEVGRAVDDPLKIEAPTPEAKPPIAPVPEPSPVPQAAPEAPRAVDTPAATAAEVTSTPAEPAPAPEPVGKGETETRTAEGVPKLPLSGGVEKTTREHMTPEEISSIQPPMGKPQAVPSPQLTPEQLARLRGRVRRAKEEGVLGPASETVDPETLTPEKRKSEGWIEAWRQDRSDAPSESIRPGSHFGTKEQAEAIRQREIDSGRTPGKLHHVWLKITNPFETTDEGFWEKPTKEAKSKGHDSLVYENEGEKVGGKSYVPFSEDQIRPFKEPTPPPAVEKQGDLEPTPSAPTQKMEGPGSPSRAQGPDTSAGGFQDQSGRDIYGIAARVREQRAKAGQVVPVPSGEGVSPKEVVEWGRELLSNGVDPEKALKDFEADPSKRISVDLIAVTRAHGESLAKAAVDVESKFGTDSTAYRTAKKALDDWDTRTKKIDTRAGDALRSLQGHTDIDTGTFTGIQRAYREATGEDLNPGQAKKAKKLAKEVSDSDKATAAATPKLDTAIDNLPGTDTPRYSPQIIKIAEKIVATLDARADKSRKALREMAAQFNALPDPTVLLHLTNIGASHIGHWGLDFAKWSDAMIKDVGPKLEDWLKKHDSSLKDIFERSQKAVDTEGDQHGANAETVKKVVKKSEPKPKAPPSLEDQRKVFGDFKEGQPMTPDQVKTLWQRAKVYIDNSLENNDPKADMGMADVVHKVATELGIPAKDVLRGLSQNGNVRRLADNVWQNQRQARILKQSAKRWIEQANDTWLSKVLPNTARAAFTAKTSLHGTVALGTHAPLVAATHPIIFAENFGKMYKLVASRDYYQMQAHQLSRRQNYTVAQRAELVNDMAKMEDFNDPKLALGFPKMAEWFRKKLGRFAELQGMGVRGYSVLKILRQDLFDHEWDKIPDSLKLDDKGQTSPQGQKLASAIADSVNHITGVVKTKVPNAANYALFAPKLELSRLAVIAGDPARAINSMLRLSNMTPAEKWFANNQWKQAAKIFAVSQGLLLANQQLNNLFGDKKKINGVPESLGGGGYNPMASDFMKFRVAGMNVAWGSPFLTMTRLPLRLVQIGMGDGGKTKFLIYPDESMYKTLGSYARTQSSPFLQPIMSLAMKADYQDRPLPQIPFYGPPPPMPKRLKAEGVKPYTWPEFVGDVVLPIPFQEGAKEIWHYGMGATEAQKAAMTKAFLTTLIMSATGGRISEDWKK